MEKKLKLEVDKSRLNIFVYCVSIEKSRNSLFQFHLLNFLTVNLTVIQYL